MLMCSNRTIRTHKLYIFNQNSNKIKCHKIHPMLGYSWPIVYDSVPTLAQYWMPTKLNNAICKIIPFIKRNIWCHLNMENCVSSSILRCMENSTCYTSARAIRSLQYIGDEKVKTIIILLPTCTHQTMNVIFERVIHSSKNRTLPRWWLNTGPAS